MILQPPTFCAFFKPIGKAHNAGDVTDTCFVSVVRPLQVQELQVTRYSLMKYIITDCKNKNRFPRNILQPGFEFTLSCNPAQPTYL